MVSSINRKELKLNKANSSDISTDLPYLDVSIENGGILFLRVMTKGLNLIQILLTFLILNETFQRLSHLECISLIRFSRACSSVEDFNRRNHRKATEARLKISQTSEHVCKILLKTFPTH